MVRNWTSPEFMRPTAAPSIEPGQPNGALPQLVRKNSQDNQGSRDLMVELSLLCRSLHSRNLCLNYTKRHASMHNSVCSASAKLVGIYKLLYRRSRALVQAYPRKHSFSHNVTRSSVIYLSVQYHVVVLSPRDPGMTRPSIRHCCTQSRKSFSTCVCKVCVRLRL